MAFNLLIALSKIILNCFLVLLGASTLDLARCSSKSKRYMILGDKYGDYIVGVGWGGISMVGASSTVYWNCVICGRALKKGSLRCVR